MDEKAEENVRRNGKRYLRQAESSAVRFLSNPSSSQAETLEPKLSKGWQRGMYTRLLPDLYPEVHLRLSLNLGQHTDRFRNPRILSNAVPLGCCFGGFSSTSGYDLGNVSSTFVELFASFGGSCPKECYSF
jgi:hypothetical protein